MTDDALMVCQEFIPSQKRGLGSLFGRWYLWPCFFLFFSMLFMPVDYKPIKIGLIVYTLVIILVRNLQKGSWFIHPQVFLLNSLITVAGLFFILLGRLNGNEYAFKTLTVYFFWPWLYVFFMSAMNSMQIFKNLFRVLIVGAIAIEIYSILFLLSSIGLIPAFLFFSFDQTQAIGLYGGFMEYNLRSISSLLFLIPFCVSLLILWPENLKPIVPKIWLWVIVVLGLATIILSGRRALWLVTVIGILLAIFCQPFFRGHGSQIKRWVGILLFFLLALPIIYISIRSPFDLSLKAMLDYFLSAFEAGSEQSSFIRYDQFFALWQDILEKPFLGWGHGAVCAGSWRHDTLPFSYELSYIALIFHTGFIGFCIYAAGVLWVYWQAVQIIRCSILRIYMAPIIIGTTCCLVANASNPYLETYDHMWVIFLPIALINYWLFQKDCFGSEGEPQRCQD